MLSATSTEWAPWYVIPADHKWFARICASAVIANALIEIDPHFPKVTSKVHQALQETKVELEAEAPRDAAPDPFAHEAGGVVDKAGKKAQKKARKAGKKARKEAAKEAAR